MSGPLLTTVLLAAAGALAVSDPAAPQRNAEPASKACATVEFIQRNRSRILASAARNDVPAAAIAGVIAAESTLNRNMVDAVQDASLAAQLALHDEKWWDGWVETWEREAERASAARLIGNKWPVAMVASGYVMSYGPAQIQPRTAVRACANAGTAEAACRGGKKALMEALLKETASVDLVGLVLRYEADRWTAHMKTEVRKDVAFLATLYSSGAEYRIASHAEMGQTPNRMGKWLVARIEAIDFVLQGKKSDVPRTAADSLCDATERAPKTERG